jgi:restriction system protein
VQGFFHGRVAELEPLLHEVDAQQGLHCKGLLAPATTLGGVGLYQRNQFGPGDHQLHGIQEFALARALGGVAQAQAALLHALYCLGFLSAWRRKQRQALVSDVAQARNADALDGMSWREFELLVGEAYRLQGYRVTEIGGGGPDGGVDLVLAKGSEKFFVQCKQWKAYKVGVTTVRELYGVMAAKGATGGFVVTSGRFTTDAKDFAQGRNIELVDGPRLFAMIQQARGAQGQPAAAQRETPTQWGARHLNPNRQSKLPWLPPRPRPNPNAHVVVPLWHCAPPDKGPMPVTRSGAAQPTPNAGEQWLPASSSLETNALIVIFTFEPDPPFSLVIRTAGPVELQHSCPRTKARLPLRDGRQGELFGCTCVGAKEIDARHPHKAWTK